MAGVAFSCVLDNTAFLRGQAFIWLNCLIHLQRIEPRDVFVHVVEPSGGEFLDWVHDQRVNVVEVERFDRRSPHCNKIQQLKTFQHTAHDRVVLMDCDTAWVGQAGLPAGSPVAACIVNEPNPSERVLLNIFNAARTGAPQWTRVELPRGRGHELTDWNNCNGGLYICDREFTVKLAPLWRFWALWGLDHRDLFEDYAVHVDQVAFALAMRELGAQVVHLPIRWNYPTHLPGGRLPDAAPEIIHFHQQLDGHLKLRPTGAAQVDAAIERLNNAIAGFLRQHLLNSVFWDLRYTVTPELGSGLGSRGASLDEKRRLLRGALAGFEEKEVVDVGCGDLEATRTLDLKRYVGIDVAESAIEIARRKRPDWSFRLGRSDGAVPEGDVVLCLDVLIHQPSESAFLALLGKLATAARERLIVTGYEAAPTLTSEITRYYLPITGALKRTGGFEKIEIIGTYRDTVMVVADKAPRPSAWSLGGRRASATAAEKIIVGSGWWYDGKKHDWALGSAVTRTPAFFRLWLRQVAHCLGPDRIVVTDSASPIKPDCRGYPVQWIELDRNYGHANDLRTGLVQTKYSGFTRSVMNGAMYAVCCDADYYVYVEQDCLLKGDNFLAHAVAGSSEDILLGAPTENGKGLGGAVAASMLQQSLIIVRRAGLERFVEGLLRAPWSDGECPPEEIMRRRLHPFGYVGVPYGRSRPIDFARPHFYAQHLDDDELARFVRSIGERSLEASIADDDPPPERPAQFRPEAPARPDRARAAEEEHARFTPYLRADRWEAEWSSGAWDRLDDIAELPHHGVVAGFVARLIGTGRLLDAGCGAGSLADYLNLDRIEYLGFDISASAVERANDRLTRGRALQSSFDQFEPPDEAAFDCIVFNESLQCTVLPLDTLDKFRSYLTQRGIMIVSLFQSNKKEGAVLAELLRDACDRGRFRLLDCAEASSLSNDLTWRIFVLASAAGAAAEASPEGG